MPHFDKPVRFLRAIAAALGLMAVAAAPPGPDPATLFGSKTKIPGALQGDIYELAPGAGTLPADFSKMKPLGTIYATRLNVPSQKFTQGFPGVTSRSEWFAINYHGTINVPQTGKYNFRLSSDDGSRLYVDDKLVIDNDGQHGTVAKEISVALTRGAHPVRIAYFQAAVGNPLALVLETGRECAAYQLFDSASFAPAVAKPAVSASQQNVFGSAGQIPFSLQGDIYGLSDDTGKLPDDFGNLPCLGRIYATQLNVPSRTFTDGFPGVTDRFVWFAIDYHGTMLIPQAGKYNFRLTSDDGSKLYIDGKLLIDNDGLHPPQTREGSIELTSGVHNIRLPYFQGPPNQIALVLEVARAGAGYQLFKTQNFAPAQVSQQNGQTKVTLGDAILFDFDKSDLKPDVDAVLKEVKASVIDPHPAAKIVIAGYTDDVGADAYNIALSGRRAQSVAAWLRRAGLPGARLSIVGYGRAQPIAPNDSDANRARNRRVEISVR